ncbi:S1-C subfamily serine protease [Deinobacterium chartae]|uniref:S1-C subfamily serine protease n=1 Tax=Deinobacterium chartae TaxID=521158 RepID=A0A841HXV3_9DEIO|nr:trypsin-like peptidase domain-containing protein [Deinobacterium chartae]MBB6096625.1 S1-C subfamily serine protease [Deinobacterium chartae]
MRRILALLGVVGLSLGGYMVGKVTAATPLATADEINTVEVSSRALKGLVKVTVRLPAALRQQGAPAEDCGSGFFYKPNLLITNYHVVQDAENIRVQLFDGRTVPAKIYGIDPGLDLAVLQVSGVNAPATLKFGNSERLLSGQKLIVLGSPFGFQNHVSTGVLSTVARTDPPAEDIGLEIPQMLFTTATIQACNSGGPVLDSRGAVVGVADANLSTVGLTVGLIGLAIPSSVVQQSVKDLEQFGVPQRGSLGITMKNLSELDPYTRNLTGLNSTDGAIVEEVPAGSVGARAGLRGTTRDVQGQLVTLGDIIIAVDGRRVKDQYDITRAVAAKRPGQSLTLKVWRNKKEINLKVNLTRRTR